MEHAERSGDSLNRAAVQATVHCLTGCAIGEILGMVIATALAWGNTASIAISIALAFVFDTRCARSDPPSGDRLTAYG